MLNQEELFNPIFVSENECLLNKKIILFGILSFVIFLTFFLFFCNLD